MRNPNTILDYKRFPTTFPYKELTKMAIFRRSRAHIDNVAVYERNPTVILAYKRFSNTFPYKVHTKMVFLAVSHAQIGV